MKSHPADRSMRSAKRGHYGPLRFNYCYWMEAKTNLYRISRVIGDRVYDINFKFTGLHSRSEIAKMIVKSKNELRRYIAEKQAA